MLCGVRRLLMEHLRSNREAAMPVLEGDVDTDAEILECLSLYAEEDRRLAGERLQQLDHAFHLIGW
jgi:hypothetical protein